MTMTSRENQELLRRGIDKAMARAQARAEKLRVAREAEIAKRNTWFRRALRGGRRFVPPPDPRWPYDPYDRFNPKWPYGPY